MKIIDINTIPRNAAQNELHYNQMGKIFFFKRYKWLFITLIFLVVTLPISFSIWYHYQAENEIKAQNDMFQAVYYFEANDFNKALEGEGTSKGLLEVIQQYPYTPSSRLACFYVGIAYMHQKEYDKAISFLKKFHCKDFIMQARAWCVIGDAYCEKKEYKRAATYYIKAACYKPNKIYTPDFLIKAAISFEADGQYKSAYDCYQKVLNNYPTSWHKQLATWESNRLSSLF